MAKLDKAKLIVYEFDPNGKGRYVKSENQFTGIEPETTTTAIIETPEEQLNVLRGNPFLYDGENRGADIFSVEDFLVKYKKKEIPLGEAIRNPDYSIFRRRRILRKAFRKWNKEYSKIKNKTFKENFRSIEVIKGIGNVKFSLINELLIWFMLLAMVFILGVDSFLWQAIQTGRFGLFISTTLGDIYNNSSWLKLLGNITLYLLVILVVYSLFFRKVIKDYKAYYNETRTYLGNSESQINKQYKIKRKNAYRHYSRYLKRKVSLFFPPLDIEEVRAGKVNISIFQNVSQAAVDKSYRIMKLEPVLKVTKLILFFGCTAGAIVVYGYSLIAIIIAAL